MSTQLEINGVSFFPIKDAAKVVSYSRDYVAKLAREEKIVASQIGRQWYVDILSLKNFAQAAELEQEVRKSKLSDQRKREQSLKAEVQTIRKEVIRKTAKARREARVIASLVLCLGILSGVGFYTAEEFSAVVAFDTNSVKTENVVASVPAVPVIEDTTVQAVVEPMPTALYTNVVEQPLFVDESEVRSLSVGNTEGILLLAKDTTVRDANSVAGLFSDEVEVSFVEGGTGIVTYTDATGKKVERVFVSVPTNAERVNEVIE
jgi:hypothetical protein